MKLKIKTATNAAKPVNEDGYINKSTAFAVIDGATSLIDAKVKDYPNNAVWITKETERYLNSNIEGYQVQLDDFPTTNKYMESLIMSLNEHLKKEYIKVCDDTSKEAEPSCGIALGKIYNNKIQLAIVGDLTIIVKMKNKDSFIFQDYRLKTLDDYAIDEIVKIAKEKGIKNLEARPLINDILIKNRNLKNTENGYSVMSTDDVLLKDIVNVSFDINEVDTIYAFTDGIAELYDTLFEYSSSDFLDLLEENEDNPQVIIDKLRDAQNKDENCELYPRFKKCDDATLSVIKILK